MTKEESGVVFDKTSGVNPLVPSLRLAISCGFLIGFGLVWGMVWGMVWGQTTPAQAPATDLSGEVTLFRIVQSDGLTPIPFAVVVNKHTGKAVMSDEKGMTSLPNRNPEDTLIFQSLGFIDLVILPNQAVPATVKLVADMVSLETAQVVSQGLASAQDVNLSSTATSMQSLKTGVDQLEVPQNAAELLWSTGSVLVQQSQQGGGSPILRGFEANRVLLVVDGVRMNNAIYRSGHLHNAITVDPQILQRTDVLLGPNGILFGSDALGGVIHYHSRSPRIHSERFRMHASTTFRSPNQSSTWHVDMDVSGQRWGSLTSATYSRYGDLKMGSWRAHGNANWGLDSVWVERVDHVDQISLNPDPTIQKRSGYDQLDLLQKFRLEVGGGMLDFNFQHSTSTDVPRYDVSNDWQNGQPKWAEWNYGPQRRSLGSAEFNRQLKVLEAQWNVLVSYQQIEESRITRRFASDWRSTRTEKVDVWGWQTNIRKRWYNGMHLTGGLSATYNDVVSTAADQHLISLEERSILTRYPSGGSTMSTHGIFMVAQAAWKQHQLSAGLRYSLSHVAASFLPNSSYTLPFESLKLRNGAVTGGISGHWKSTGDWSAHTALTTGFRHPNIDDIGKVREKGGFVVVPNDSIRPEYLTSFEQSVSWDFQRKGILRVTCSGFASFLDDAIVPENVLLAGSPFLVVDGDSAMVQTNVNADEAWVTGARLEATVQLTPMIGLQAAVNWTNGALLNTTSGEEATPGFIPMAHIPPVFGRIAFDFEKKWLTTKCYVLFSGKKRAEDFGPYSTDNLEYMLPEGSPAWWTLNLEIQLNLWEQVKWRVGAHNLFDMHYRVFASGISAPGRGIYTSLHATF